MADEGRGDRIRTYDLFVPNEARYRAALHPVMHEFTTSPDYVHERLGKSLFLKNVVTESSQLLLKR